MSTKQWKNVRRRAVRPDDEPQIQRTREAMRAEIRLADLRKHRGASQETVARKLEVSQSNVSQLERGEDVKLSTLEGYVNALGGKLEVRAVFDDEIVPIG